MPRSASSITSGSYCSTQLCHCAPPIPQISPLFYFGGCPFLGLFSWFTAMVISVGSSISCLAMVHSSVATAISSYNCLAGLTSSSCCMGVRVSTTHLSTGAVCSILDLLGTRSLNVILLQTLCLNSPSLCSYVIQPKYRTNA